MTSYRLGHFRVFLSQHAQTQNHTEEQFKRLFNLLKTKRVSFM